MTLEEAYRAFAPDLVRYASAHGHSGEDVAQDVFIRASRYFPLPEDDAKRILMHCARNRMIDIARYEANRPTADPETPFLMHRVIDDEDARIAVMDVQTAWWRLTPSQRNAVREFVMRGNLGARQKQLIRRARRWLRSA